MHILPAESADPPTLNGAERARQRLDRIAAPTPGHEPRFRDADAPVRPRRARHGTGKREGFRLGWFGWLVVDAFAVALILGAVFVWPPVSACREQEEKIGFYAGDTLGKCVQRGVAARIEVADQRIKMAIRGSGK